MKTKKITSPLHNDDTTEKHLNKMQRGSSNILVAVRVRPRSYKEELEGQPEIVHILDGKVIILKDMAPADSYLSRPKEKHYAFDLALPSSATQQEVFNKTTGFLISGVLGGFNATVFAYGATGAGKTHTMLGDREFPGIMLSTFSEFFASISALSVDKDYNVKLSYLEIYNEVVRDLLASEFSPLDIREDKRRGITIPDLTELTATSAQQVESAIASGSKKRACESTNANEVSSRSHAVLQATVEHRKRTSGTEAAVYIGKLSLIDLAGSERAAKTNNKGIRLIEGANINRSLLALGNCINALCDAHGRQASVYIPYRDSKLTRILKDSLGGNCRTVMIACVATGASCFDDTHNTLEYANRAKNIKTSVKRNSLNVQVHISKYTTVITQLKQEVDGLKEQLNKKQPGLQFPIENYMIEVSRHFKEELQCKKEIVQMQGDNESTGFSIYSKQTEQDRSYNVLQQGLIENELDCMRKSVYSNDKHIRELHKKLAGLKEKRLKFYEHWENQNIPEYFLTQLKLKMKYHIIKLKSIESEDKDQRSEALIRQKDSMIAFLTEQVELKNNIIGTNTDLLVQKDLEQPHDLPSNIKNLKTVNSHSSFPDNQLAVVSIPSPHKLMAFQGASPTRIPKFGAAQKHAPIKHAATRILSPGGSQKKVFLSKRKTFGTQQSESLFADADVNGVCVPESIAARVKRSPYINPDLQSMGAI